MRRLTVDILEEVYRRLRDLADEQGWTEDEAVRSLVHYGISAIEACKTLESLEGEDDTHRIRKLKIMLMDTQVGMQHSSTGTSC